MRDGRGTIRPINDLSEPDDGFAMLGEMRRQRVSPTEFEVLLPSRENSGWVPTRTTT